ncbi:hypothetical protein G6684_01725 [Polynucleobacter paneuropaeus]|nr:hypothetical protein G6684_01725 [Polynucleobacter paneuropaeus]
MNKRLNIINYFIIFFLITGYPKDPVYGLPLLLLVLIFFPRKVISALLDRNIYPQYVTLFIFVFYCLIRLALQDEATAADYYFIINITYKVIVGFIIARIFIYLLEYKYLYLYLYLLIQILIIVCSYFYSPLYNFLLNFQTQDARNVFMHTFGLRSMGFGIVHNEGVVFLVIIYNFLIYRNQSRFLGAIISPIIYLIGLSSRFGIVLIMISQFLISPFKLGISILIFFVCFIFFIDINSEELSSVFEVYRNYVDFGGVSTASTDALMTMQYMPNNFFTFLVGDGQFFSSDGFYMGTDIGFSRILFFGGILGLILYFLITCWPLFFMQLRHRDKKFYMLLTSILICFLLSNIKGLVVENWVFIALMLMDEKSINYNFGLQKKKYL